MSRVQTSNHRKCYFVKGISSPFAHPFIIPDVPSQLERAKAKLNTQGSQVMDWLVMGPL